MNFNIRPTPETQRKIDEKELVLARKCTKIRITKLGIIVDYWNMSITKSNFYERLKNVRAGERL